MADTLIAMQGAQAVSASSGLALPALFAPDAAAARRFVEFFAAHIT
jgi:hypothetical protein